MSSNGTHTPPEPPLTFSGITPASIAAETELSIANSAALRDRLVRTLTPSTATFTNLILPLIDSANLAARRFTILKSLLVAVSRDAEIRDASREAAKKASAAEAASFMRADMAELVAAVYSRQREEEDLDEQDRHLLSRMHGEYVRSGAGRTDGTQRERLVDAQRELNELRAAAQKTFIEGDDVDGVSFSRDELDEVSNDVLDAMKRAKEGDFWVAFRKEEHVREVWRYASSEETRRRMYVAEERRFPENVARLEMIVVLRDEIAKLLGFDNHASLKMEDKMARSVEEVRERLSELRKKLRPIGEAEIGKLLQFKTKDNNNQLDVPEVLLQFHKWDLPYYANKQRKAHFSYDSARVADYFEVTHTITSMLDLFEKIFRMQFEHMQASVWDETVTLYSVWDSESVGGGFLGYLYVDPFRRQGKRRGNYHLPIRRGFFEANGTQHYPVSVLVCSFAPPTPSQPSLLQHGEVQDLFHELGHGIHNLVSKTKYALVPSRDFVEIPSIMLENWIWEPSVLTRLGKHHSQLSQETEESSSEIAAGMLPLILANDIARTKNLNKATNVLAMIQRAIFDLEIHTPATHEAALEMETTSLWNATKRDVLPFSFRDEADDLGFGQAGFGHIFRTYDAAFFSYALSLVYAADMYASYFKKDPLDEEAGMKYRREVLERGSGVKEAEILERFLRRKFSIDPFFDELKRGLEV